MSSIVEFWVIYYDKIVLFVWLVKFFRHNPDRTAPRRCWKSNYTSFQHFNNLWFYFVLVNFWKAIWFNKNRGLISEIYIMGYFILKFLHIRRYLWIHNILFELLLFSLCCNLLNTFFKFAWSNFSCSLEIFSGYSIFSVKFFFFWFNSSISEDWFTVIFKVWNLEWQLL